MTTIHKYPIQITDEQTVRMPAGAHVLTAQAQEGETRLCLWVMVDTSKPMTDYRVWVHGTGHQICDAATCGRYIGSAQMLHGRLIWHVFVEDARWP